MVHGATFCSAPALSAALVDSESRGTDIECGTGSRKMCNRAREQSD